MLAQIMALPLLFSWLAYQTQAGFEVYHFGKVSSFQQIDNSFHRAKVPYDEWVQEFAPRFIKIMVLDTQVKTEACSRRVDYAVSRVAGLGYAIVISPDTLVTHMDAAMESALSIVNKNLEPVMVLFRGCLD